MTSAQSAVIRHDIMVKAPLARAFQVFTERFGDFKPREHNLLGVPIAETVLEPRAGGRIYDRGVDDSVCVWARVLVFDSPRRLVFSWDIGTTWQVESDPARCSEVEVLFTAEADGRTRVTLEHRHIERHGDGWDSVASGVGGDAGWPLYLRRFGELLELEAQ
ncbi:SRPBCC family protein [Mycobacterium sp. 852014-52144_SCH5372336]|uniref:SRPBCC family protein n=1 Tax=Mycobacterium sp. 852014-52144_SCH5372336 TaxID=1834115 RepID=UPI000800D57C|nr:SRPBCC family protein [Mycobacterium sp. 852014-52144_SCH5372336]OBB71644.1 ATPase [Mycobacterium sp. 852014-52144_SCH5372336]